MISERGQEILAENARRAEERVARMATAARTLSAGGRPLAIGSPVLILADGVEVEGAIAWAHEDGTIDAIAGPDILVANRPPKLDRLQFGTDWRWPSNPPPMTAA
jgi:hypothetical protein